MNLRYAHIEKEEVPQKIKEKLEQGICHDRRGKALESPGRTA